MGLFALLDEKQFKQILFLLNANNGALNKLAENVGPPETSVVEELRNLNSSMERIATALENLTAPAPTPEQPLEVKFMFVVKDDHAPVNSRWCWVT